jgi:hypothetical protein
VCPPLSPRPPSQMPPAQPDTPMSLAHGGGLSGDWGQLAISETTHPSRVGGCVWPGRATQTKAVGVQLSGPLYCSADRKGFVLFYCFVLGAGLLCWVLLRR